MIHAVNQITKTNDDYAFTVYGNQGKVSKLVNVGGIDVPVVIDSGATVNIIDTFGALKKNKIKCESKTSSKNLYAYGCNKPLTIAGSFNTNVCVNDRCVSADFFVIEEDGQALLGHKTSIELGVLKTLIRHIMTIKDRLHEAYRAEKFCNVKLVCEDDKAIRFHSVNLQTSSRGGLLHSIPQQINTPDGIGVYLENVRKGSQIFVFIRSDKLVNKLEIWEVEPGSRDEFLTVQEIGTKKDDDRLMTKFGPGL
ncbi:unnamed protein product [Mytilus edulis]|uniref:Uncharacterized protein n=1 Tax=Mytilus edulis TaxID=6550 RepID=A0A8S3RI89_MYTED|nr:unnamed protein product [Mytilus edulis]